MNKLVMWMSDWRRKRRNEGAAPRIPERRILNMSTRKQFGRSDERQGKAAVFIQLQVPLPRLVERNKHETNGQFTTVAAAMSCSHIFVLQNPNGYRRKYPYERQNKEDKQGKRQDALHN